MVTDTNHFKKITQGALVVSAGVGWVKVAVAVINENNRVGGVTYGVKRAIWYYDKCPIGKTQQ